MHHFTNFSYSYWISELFRLKKILSLKHACQQLLSPRGTRVCVSRRSYAGYWVRLTRLNRVDMGRQRGVVSVVAIAALSRALGSSTPVRLDQDRNGVWWFTSGSSTTAALTPPESNDTTPQPFVSLGVDHVMYSGDRFGPEGSPYESALQCISCKTSCPDTLDIAIAL